MLNTEWPNSCPLIEFMLLGIIQTSFHVEHLIHSDRFEEKRVWHASGQFFYFALVHCYLPCSNISAIYNLLYLSLILTHALIYYFNHLFAHWYYFLFIYILFVILSREMWSWVYGTRDVQVDKILFSFFLYLITSLLVFFVSQSVPRYFLSEIDPD